MLWHTSWLKKRSTLKLRPTWTIALRPYAKISFFFQVWEQQKGKKLQSDIHDPKDSRKQKLTS